MALAPLSASPRPGVELPRGTDQERRRQESNFFAASQSLQPAAQRTGGAGQKPIDAIDERQARRVSSQIEKRPEQSPTSSGGGPFDVAAEAARLVRNDRGSFFAAIGFEAQKLAQEQDDAATPENKPRQAEKVSQAYQSAAGAAGANLDAGKTEIFNGFLADSEQSQRVDLVA